MRRVLVAFAVALTLVVVAPGQAARPRSPVLSGCLNKLLVRPSRIEVCGDGNFYLTDLRWASWSKSGAVGAAVAHQNDCTPSCAAGHYHLYSAAVWLTRARMCSDGRVQYTRLSYEFLALHPTHISAGPHVVPAPLDLGAAHCP